MTDEKALYDNFIADYYDTSPILVQRTQDVGFYVNSVKKYGDPALELGCGTGRITLAVAEVGYRIVGLDLSEKMLRRAEEKRAKLSREARERVHLVQADMTTFDQIACLNRVKQHLAPKGRLILDFFQTDAQRMHDPKFLQEAALAEYDLPDGRHVGISERIAAFHRGLQRNDVEMIFSVRHPGGKHERLVMAWTLRYFFRYEVEHLLARCGFQLEALYGNFDRSPLTDDSSEMIFVASP